MSNQGDQGLPVLDEDVSEESEDLSDLIEADANGNPSHGVEDVEAALPEDRKAGDDWEDDWEDGDEEEEEDEECGGQYSESDILDIVGEEEDHDDSKEQNNTEKEWVNNDEELNYSEKEQDNTEQEQNITDIITAGREESRPSKAKTPLSRETQALVGKLKGADNVPGQAGSPIQLSPLMEADDDAARWMIYKRIFVTDAYNIAMDNIFTTNCACLMVAVLCMGYNVLGLLQALIITLLGVPLAIVAICRTVVLWRLVLRSGPDVKMGIHDYWIKDKNNRSIYTAKYQSKLVGTVALVALSSKVAEISRIATEREFVRKGVGTCLMKYILLLCEANGFEEVVLTVGESNYPGCVLFDKFGFKVIREVNDTFYKFLKWRGFLMRLRLHQPDPVTEQPRTRGDI